MTIPSIQELASRARDVAKFQKITMRDAIHSVSKEYDVSCCLIARELSHRAKCVKEKERDEEIKRLRDEKYLAGARAHERELKRSFIDAGHLHDY